MASRAHLVLGWALILAAALYFFMAFRGAWALDLTAIYFAAHFYAEGQFDMVYLPGPEVFLYEVPPAWEAFAHEVGRPEEYLTPYLYPPLWAAVLAPIVEAVSVFRFFNMVLVVNLVSMAGMIWLAFRLVRSPRLGFAPWAALSLVLVGSSSMGLMGLWLGQPQIFVAFVTLLAFHEFAERRDLTAGAVLALAAAMKLSPAIFVVIFVMEGRWRAVAAFAVVGGGFALASIAVAGWPLHAAFLDKLHEVSAHVQVSRIVAGFELMLWQAHQVAIGEADWLIRSPFMAPEPGWIGWATRLILLGGLVAIWRTTRALPMRARLWARFFSVSLLALLTNPLPWIHYLVLPLVLLPGFVRFWPMSWTLALAVVTGGLISMPLFFIVARRNELSYPQPAFSFALTLALLVIVLVSAAKARRTS